MDEGKIKFYFPTTKLTKEDYSPVESDILKDYYSLIFFVLIS